MKKIVAALCCLFTFSLIADDNSNTCQENYTRALMGCQYMQQSCFRRYHRETDVEYCIGENLNCVRRAQTEKEACENTAAEKNCQTTCESTGMYDMSQVGRMFGGRCFEIIDCAIRSWNNETKQCHLNRHEERRSWISCHHIPPA